MICAHCHKRDTTVLHVRACSIQSQSIRSIGAVAPEPPLSALPNETAIEGVYLGCDASVTGAPVSYYKVQRSPNTARTYAKRWDGAEWIYEGRAPLYFLRSSDRVTAEQAAEFGHVSGQCVFCSRGLTDERSLAVGYGPVCADHNGLPWGEKAVSA